MKLYTRGWLKRKLVRDKTKLQKNFEQDHSRHWLSSSSRVSAL